MNAILSAFTPQRKISAADPALSIDDKNADDNNANFNTVAPQLSKGKTPSSSKQITPFRKAVDRLANTPRTGASSIPAQGSPLPKQKTPSSARRAAPVMKPVANDANTPKLTPKPTLIENINYDEMEVEIGGGEEEEEAEEDTAATAVEEVPGEVPEEVEQDVEQDEEYTFQHFLSHRWVENSIEIQVEWDQGGTTWEPEENLHHDAPDTLFAYWREQGGRPTNPIDPEMFEVFAIRKHKKNRNRLLVEWVGYEPSEATWVPRRIIEETAGDVVAEYWESIKKK